jgi:hypothetical protein
MDDLKTRVSMRMLETDGGERSRVVVLQVTPKRMAHDAACDLFFRFEVRPLLLKGENVAIVIVEPQVHTDEVTP